MAVKYGCYTVKYRVRIIRFNEMPIKLQKNIYQQTKIVQLFVHTYLCILYVYYTYTIHVYTRLVLLRNHSCLLRFEVKFGIK